MSLRYVCVCGNVARIAAVLLIVCGSDVSPKGVFRVSLRSAAQCCPEASFRGVAQKCRSKATFTCVCACVCSAVLIGSADQKHRSEVLLRTVDQRCRSSAVSNQKCCSTVLLGSVGRKCCSAVWIRSVDEKCRS